MSTDSRGQFVALMVVLLVLHFVLRVGLGLGAFVPDLLLVAFLLASRRLRPGWAAGLGVLLGLLEGAVTFTVGPSSLVLAVLGYFGSRTREVVAGESAGFLAFYLFAGKWTYDALLFLVTIKGAAVGSGMLLLLFSPILALYAAVAGLLAMAAYRSVA